MKHPIHRALTLALCLALLLCALPVPALALSGGGTAFPDVPADAWYAGYIGQITGSFPGIILNGIVDRDGVTRFHPDDQVKRGEFLKMAICAAEVTQYLFTTDASRNGIHWSGEYYTLALADNLLTPNILGAEDHGELKQEKQGVATELFPCSFEALEQPISRYEMAVILSNLCANTLMEKNVIANAAYEHIADYEEIDAKFSTAVEQAFGKGLLTGFEDNSFRGEETLTRAQAAAVIERLLWDNDRQVPAWSEEQPAEVEPAPSASAEFRGYKSFAFWLQDHMDSWSRPNAEARKLMYGDASKTGFSSAADAAPYMETVTVPIWIVDKNGLKQSSTASLTVHKLVAEEVRLIFRQIYDDPEQFPIYAGWSVGGARFSDSGRHSWGMAIDINALYNAEMNFKSGYLRVTCGYGWQPAGVATWMNRSVGSYLGTMSGASPYSITPTGSVVRAFAEYGWGWGGSGSNVVGQGKGWSNGLSFDFMHFSVLSSGG